MKLQKQQVGIYWTNSKEIADRWAIRCRVQGLNGVRGYSAYIFIHESL